MNLSLSIDISNALDKAVEYLDSSEREEPSVCIKATKPFALRMRIYKYIKAYNKKDAEGVGKAGTAIKNIKAKYKKQITEEK